MEIKDPLAVVQMYLQLNPNEEENRALRKLLRAIADGTGALEASDALLFQGELGELTAALLDAHQQNRYTPEEWQLVAMPPATGWRKTPGDLH